jgi:hypothetical protein
MQTLQSGSRFWVVWFANKANSIERRVHNLHTKSFDGCRVTQKQSV